MRQKKIKISEGIISAIFSIIDVMVLLMEGIRKNKKVDVNIGEVILQLEKSIEKDDQIIIQDNLAGGSKDQVEEAGDKEKEVSKVDVQPILDKEVVEKEEVVNGSKKDTVVKKEEAAGPKLEDISSDVSHMLYII